MKRFLLFAWPDINEGNISIFAGWNSFRGSYDSYDAAARAFVNDFSFYELGQIVDMESADIWTLKQ